MKTIGVKVVFGLGATVLGLATIKALKEGVESKHEASVRIAEIEANSKKRTSTKRITTKKENDGN